VGDLERLEYLPHMLVTTDWLQAHLDDRDLVVVDLRWHEDGSGRARYEAGHIPGAVFCDWSTDLVDTEHRFAFMLAPPWRFAEQMRRLGISDETKVVAYSDRLGSGPFRLWWACRVYGHQQVRILDGGLKKWLGEERPVSSTSFRPRPRHEWTPRHGEPLVATGQDVAEGERDPRITVLDSRPEEQFLGEAVWFFF